MVRMTYPVTWEEISPLKNGVGDLIGYEDIGALVFTNPLQFFWIFVVNVNSSNL